MIYEVKYKVRNAITGLPEQEEHVVEQNISQVAETVKLQKQGVLIIGSIMLMGDKR